MKRKLAFKEMKDTMISIKVYNGTIKRTLDDDEKASSVGTKLVNQQYIIQVNELYTMGRMVCGEEKNQLVLCNTNFPVLFNSDDVDEIIENISFTDGNGDHIVPQKVYWRDWYTHRYETNLMVIKTIESLFVKKEKEEEENVPATKEDIE
jgi:hypothetical protein